MSLPLHKFKDPVGTFSVLIGTFFGSGLLPKMPGTWGSLAAMPLVFYSHAWQPNHQFLFWIALTAIGTFAAKEICERTRCADNQTIVIDEVIGLGITAWTSGASWRWMWISFLVFRFFDMTKVPPVGAVDKWSKATDSYWTRGFGVLADDILAGFQGVIVIMLLQGFFGLN